MHDAPSVTYPVGRCRFAAAAAACLWLLGAAALAAWSWQAAAGGWRIAAGASAWLLAGAAAAAGWWRSPRGDLRWDGAGWHFGEQDAALSGRPHAVLDLQRRMLLRVAGAGGTLWLWAERDSAPSYWDALRRAVYSRASAGAPQGAQPPADSP